MMNKLVIALASGAAAATVAMADNDHGNVNFAGPTFTSSYTPQTFSAPPQPQFYDSHAAASFNTPFGGAQGGLQVGQPSSLISTAITVVGGLMLFSFLMQFIGKVTSLPFIQKLFGTDKESTSRMARALLSSISEEDINEYTHMAIAAIDKFSEMNNFPKQ